MTRVVHLRKEPFDILIDWTTKWGNPYKTHSGFRSRGEAIRLFEEHVRTRPEFIAQIKRELRGKILGCWCRPRLACHGDVLARIAEEPDARV